MKTKNFGYSIVRGLVVGALFFVGSAMTSPAGADDARNSAQLVDKARMTLEHFVTAPEMGAFRKVLKDAQGVFIAPQVLKGAFIFGASGGSGVFMVRDQKTGTWAGPAFYTIGEASFGLQAGGKASEVILLAMSEKGVKTLLGNSAKLGADVGVAVGPVGMGAAVSNANLTADIIIGFASSKGLFGGIAVDGAVVKVRNGLNESYYNKTKISPTDILILRTVTNPQAESLTKAVAMAVEGKTWTKVVKK
jgi:Uncharacterized conserved protein